MVSFFVGLILGAAFCYLYFQIKDQLDIDD